MAPSVFDGAALSVAHPVFDLGEGLLDRIEVRGIWRQVPEPGASGADHLPDRLRLVAAEIVENNDIAWVQSWQEKVLDIGSEAFSIDRPIEDARCCEPIVAKRAEEGQGAPVAVRDKASQASALRPPSSQRGHVGFDPGLIDEDEPARIEPSLPGSPTLTPAGDVCTSLLKREQCFF